MMTGTNRSGPNFLLSLALICNMQGKHMKTPITLLALILIPSALFAADYLGANAILEKLETLTAATATNTAASPAGAFHNDLTNFPARAATLPPNDAAREWLALYDRLMALSPSDLMDIPSAPRNERPGMATLVGALPPAAAWDAIATQVAARPTPDDARGKYRENLLRLLVHVLVNDQPASRDDLASLAILIANSDSSMAEYVARQYQELMRSLNTLTGDKKGVKEAFESSLTFSAASEYEDYLPIPDLASMLGPEDAERLLRKALLLPKTRLNFELGDNTKALARKLAIEQVSQIKIPPWDLVSSLDAVELYEALNTHFPKKGQAAADGTDLPMFINGAEASLADLPAEALESMRKVMSQSRGGNDYQRDQARIYYLLGLIVHGRQADARKLIEGMAAEMTGKSREASIPDEALLQLEKAGYVAQVHDFLRELLLSNPDLPIWEQYIDLSAKTGQTAAMLDLITTNANNTSISPPRRRELQRHLVRALLAADKPEEAIAITDRLLAEKETSANDRLTLAVQQASLGHLLKRNDWLEAGLRAARAAQSDKDEDSSSSSSYSYSYSYAYPSYSLADLLIEIGRGPEAEQCYLDSLVRSLKPGRANNSHSYYSSSSEVTILSDLASLYAQAGRHDDVLALLEHAPWWGVADLAQLRAYNFSSGSHERGHQKTPVLQAAAEALHARGRDADAIPLLEYSLQRGGGFDPAYALYLQIRGTNALAFLDALYNLDRYEERPLIWKAHLLRESGQLDTAEKVARDAIAIDPSDGEQGKGRRMRVYAELADILTAKGDLQNAKFFREVVSAIRISENADDVYSAGLLKRGVQMYEEALSHFADAYCIQSRMAIQMEEIGDFVGAEKHYQRAYELMPDSFGRVESHCFGCEGAFRSGRAQNIAERVFASLAERTPEKPQVHYLLGYLRDAQGRHDEALTAYRQAVSLDPEYLNAWKKIGEIGERKLLPAADRDAVALMQLKLDPLSRHGQPDTQTILDLKALWQALVDAQKLAPKIPESLYPLTASAARLKEKAAEKSQTSMGYQVSHDFDGEYSGNDSAANPAQALRTHSVLNDIIQLFDYATQLEILSNVVDGNLTSTSS